MEGIEIKLGEYSEQVGEYILSATDGDPVYAGRVSKIVRELAEIQIYSPDVGGGKLVAAESQARELVGFVAVNVKSRKLPLWEQVLHEEAWLGEDEAINSSGAELMYVYVRPEMRRKGVGKQMMKSILAWLRQERVTNVYAYVSPYRQGLRAFYSAVGASELVSLADGEGESDAAFLEWKI